MGIKKAGDSVTVDKAEYHIEDAGTWEAAARHIALFLLLASRRGLTSDLVDKPALAADPVGYLLNDWDGALIGRDMLSERGRAFAVAHYDAYLETYAAAVSRLDGDGVYDDVDLAELVVELTPWFDERHA